MRAMKFKEAQDLVAGRTLQEMDDQSFRDRWETLKEELRELDEQIGYRALLLNVGENSYRVLLEGYEENDADGVIRYWRVEPPEGLEEESYTLEAIETRCLSVRMVGSDPAIVVNIGEVEALKRSGEIRAGKVDTAQSIGRFAVT